LDLSAIWLNEIAEEFFGTILSIIELFFDACPRALFPFPQCIGVRSSDNAFEYSDNLCEMSSPLSNEGSHCKLELLGAAHDL
jgi:hypothetical protein